MSYNLPMSSVRWRKQGFSVQLTNKSYQQRISFFSKKRIRNQQQHAELQEQTLKLSQHLDKIDKLLSSDRQEDEEEAIQLMEKLRKDNIVKGFGQGRQIPKRIYSLEELKLNSIQPEKLLAPKDDTLIVLRNITRIAFVVGTLSLNQVFHGDLFRTITVCTGALISLLWFDQAITGGGVETLILDSLGRQFITQYRQRVALHEAGHFLIAYLIGLLPKSYTLSTWAALQSEGSLNMQAGCRFCDSRFNTEVKSGTLSSSSLSQFACVALAGVATEFERFGLAEGGLADVQQLDQLLNALKFTQKKADGEIRWAVLNVVLMLRRHGGIHTKLANQMDQGKSVSELITMLEKELSAAQDI